MELFLQPEAWLALLTLTFMEIVLGIDNIVFISLVTNKLQEKERIKARFIGISLALIVRIFMLLGISYLIGFTQPIITLGNFSLSGRDLILGIGGIFLLAKSTSEIHTKIEGDQHEHTTAAKSKFGSVVFQIILLDIIFSFDSILTAVGLTEHLILMIIAIIISMIIMMVFAGKISQIIEKYPTLQILALSFLILIGFMLVIEGLHFHIPKGYIYFAMFFSLGVELINIKVRRKEFNKNKK